MKIVFISTPNDPEKELDHIKELITTYYGRVRFITSSNNDNFDESDSLEKLSTVDMAFSPSIGNCQNGVFSNGKFARL